ncbi:DgyrCDS2135 [Dimorphilus gyrociliatus]|uniref:DgyrCDS2135 n=1 Tax=Dimorphilus gyrociliatus TaxID=2664684 RepID=A0A7I8V9J8_9ANNE|nr:DgyrCDS2135 [Dimorphilus gyrociliatus]
MNKQLSNIYIARIVIDISSTEFFSYFNQFLIKTIQDISLENLCIVTWLIDKRQLEICGDSSHIRKTKDLIITELRNHGYLEIVLSDLSEDLDWEKTENLAALLSERELQVQVKYFGNKLNILQTVSDLGKDSRTESITCFIFKNTDYFVHDIDVSNTQANDMALFEQRFNDAITMRSDANGTDDKIDECKIKKFEHFCRRGKCFRFYEKSIFSYVFAFFKPILNNSSHHIFFSPLRNELSLAVENSGIFDGLIYILEETLRESLQDIIQENLQTKPKVVNKEEILSKLAKDGKRRREFLLEYDKSSNVRFVGRKQVLKKFLQDNNKIFTTSRFKLDNKPINIPHSHLYKPTIYQISADIGSIPADAVAISLPVKRFILDTGASLSVRDALAEEDILKIQKILLQKRYCAGEYFYEDFSHSQWKGFGCIIVSKTNLYSYLKSSTSSLLQEIDSNGHQTLLMTIFGGSFDDADVNFDKSLKEIFEAIESTRFYHLKTIYLAERNPRKATVIELSSYKYNLSCQSLKRPFNKELANPYHTEKCLQRAYNVQDKFFITIQLCPKIFDCNIDLMILIEFDLPEKPSIFFEEAIQRFSILEKNKLINIEKKEIFHFVGNVKNLLVLNYNTKSNNLVGSNKIEDDIIDGINNVLERERIESIVFKNISIKEPIKSSSIGGRLQFDHRNTDEETSEGEESLLLKFKSEFYDCFKLYTLSSNDIEEIESNENVRLRYLKDNQLEIIGTHKCVEKSRSLLYNLLSQYGIIYMKFNEEYDRIVEKFSIYGDLRLFKLPNKSKTGTCFGNKEQLRDALNKNLNTSCINCIRIKIFSWENEIYESRQKVYSCKRTINGLKIENNRTNQQKVHLEPEPEGVEERIEKIPFLCSSQLTNYYWFKFKEEIEKYSKKFPNLMTLVQGKHLVPIDQRVSEDTSSFPSFQFESSMMNKKFQFEDYPLLELQYGSFFETKTNFGLLIELNEPNNPSAMLQEVKKLLSTEIDMKKLYSYETQQEYISVGEIEKLTILNYSNESQHSRDFLWQIERDILKRLVDIIDKGSKIETIGLTNLAKGFLNFPEDCFFTVEIVRSMITEHIIDKSKKIIVITNDSRDFIKFEQIFNVVYSKGKDQTVKFTSDEKRQLNQGSDLGVKIIRNRFSNFETEDVVF